MKKILVIGCAISLVASCSGFEDVDVSIVDNTEEVKRPSQQLPIIDFTEAFEYDCCFYLTEDALNDVQYILHYQLLKDQEVQLRIDPAPIN